MGTKWFSGVLLALLVFASPANADMYQDASNAKLPTAGTPTGAVCGTASGSLIALAGGCIAHTVLGPGTSTLFSVPVYNGTSGASLADPNLMLMNAAGNDGHSGNLNGNAIILMQPAMGVIGAIDHTGGLFIQPTITGCPTPTTCPANTAATVQWGNALSGTANYVPAGTGGALGGWNVNIYTNQTIADMGSFNNSGAFGATIHTSAGAQVDGLDVDFELATAAPNNMVGVSIYFNNSIAPNTGKALIGFNAQGGGSVGGTTAFRASGPWANGVMVNAPSTFGPFGGTNTTNSVLAYTQNDGIRALGAQAIVGTQTSDIVTIGGFAASGYNLLRLEDSNTGTLGGGIIRFAVAAGGAVSMPSLPNSAGAGGIFVCVDSAGKLYKKATCP